MIGYIYKITNKSGRVYIGKTFDIKKRFRQYKNLNCVTQPALYKSLLKYGYNSHIKEIIYQGECDNDFLSKKEIYYISVYDSFKNGLNCTIGGDSGFMIGDDNVSKRDDIRKKMSLSAKNRYRNNIHPRKGKPHTKETIDKIKEVRLKQKNPSMKLRVKCLKTGKIYESLKSLSDELNIKYKSFFYKIKYTNFYQDDYEIICKYN